MPTQRSRLESIFLAAAELPRAEQEAFLERECAADPNLLPLLRDMLEQDRAASAAAGWRGPAWSSAALRFGPYRVTGCLGSGGMGVVYAAVRDDDEFEKRVAIKTVPRALLTEIGIERLRKERQILAGLDHPYIARLLDGGTTDEGSPYVVMEYIDGEPITVYAASRSLDVAGRVRLFLRVAAAVQFAHSNLILHRDLKPSNILVTVDGTPKLLDFGNARVLDSHGEHTLTLAAMTPEYASPEQLRGASLTTASDVYSLGVVLFQLLTGTLPYRQAGTPAELADAICHQQPEFPREAARAAGSDLRNIVLKALRKEPERRYSSVEQLAEDLRRYLEGRPVMASKGTLLYRAGKFLQRNKVAGLAAAAVLLALVGGILSTTAQRDRAERLRVRAERDEASTRQLLYAAQMNLAFEAWEGADVQHVNELLEAQRPHAGQMDLRGFEWRLLRGLVNRGSRILYGPAETVQPVVFSPDGAKLAGITRSGTLLILDAVTGRAVQSLANGLSYDVAFSPDGKWIAAGSGKGQARIWSVEEGRVVRTLNPQTAGVWSCAISPDGHVLALGSIEGSVTLWDIDSGRLLAKLTGHREGVTSLAFSRDGRALASASRDRTAKLWDLRTVHLQATLEGHTWWVLSVAFSPDGATLATAGSDGEIRFWDAASHREVAAIHGDGSTINSVKFSSGGGLLATADAANRVKVYQVPSRELEATLRAHTDSVESVAFSPDGRTLASASLDHTIRLWDLTRLGGALVLDGHRDWVWNVAFSPDGRRLASAGKDGAVRVWDAAGAHTLLTLQHPQWVNGVAFSPDGSKLATAADDGFVRLWNASSGQPVATPRRHGAVAECVAFSADGKILASGSKDGEILLFDISRGAEIASLRSRNRHIIWGIAFSPDGRYLAAAEGGMRDLQLDTAHVVTIWDVAARRPAAVLGNHTQDVRAVAFSPKGDVLASGSFDGTIRLWDARTFRELATLRSHRVQSLAFLADGQRLMSGGQDKTVRFWNIATLQQVGRLGVPSEVNSVAASPDGRVVAAGSNDGKVRVWAGDR